MMMMIIIIIIIIVVVVVVVVVIDSRKPPKACETRAKVFPGRVAGRPLQGPKGLREGHYTARKV